MPESTPIVQFDADGKPVVLKFNIPEPTTYTGRNYIELDFPADYFPAQTAQAAPVGNMGTIGMIMANPMLLNLATGPTANTDEVRNVLKNQLSRMKKSSRTTDQQIDDIAKRSREGFKPKLVKRMSGKVEVVAQKPASQPRPRLILVEIYQLSTFLGQYGAGRTIKTFSLLPGERTKISVKSYMKTSTEAKEASSILDSFTEESADDFEDTVQSESMQKSNSQETFDYHAEVEAEAKWGWGKAKVSGGIKGGSLSAREDFSKGVMNSTKKHSMKASAKRDVEINTSYEVKTESTQETSMERDLVNINVGRTLNFIFRQMNQEFITCLHLVDVKLAYFDGREETKFEVGISEMGNFLRKTLKPERVAEVQAAITDQLMNILDHKDQRAEFVETTFVKDAAGRPIPGSDFLRIKKDMVSQYVDPVTGTAIKMPGVLINVQKNVMRTDGVIVESVLGQGEGLDTYSKGLQDEAVRSKRLENDRLQLDIDRQRAALKALQEKDTNSAQIFSQLFNPPKETTH